MHKTRYAFFQLTAILFSLTAFVSCNNSGNIPFPEKELSYTQPVTVPLVFSTTKRLKWDTARKDGITPVIKKFDINALPAFPYDSTGFKPFSKPPEETHFDFNKLPEKDCDLDKLPSHPLNFKTTELGPIPIVRAGSPVMQKGKPLAIYDFAISQVMQTDFVGALYKDRTGLLWIGGSGGLLRYDGDHIQTFVHFTTSSNPIGGIIEDNAGKIWFIQAGEGAIGVLDPHNGTVGYSSQIGAVGNDITRISKDDKGNIWLYNSNDKAMSIIDPVRETYRNFNVKAGLSDELAGQMLEDNNKNIWISTNDKGIDIIIPSKGKIKYLGKINGLSSDSIVAMTKDKNGLIWAAVPGGVEAVDIKNSTIKHYNQFQGFRQGFPFNLSFDSNGNLWKVTNKGIDVADFQNRRTRHIDQSNGLSGNSLYAFATDNYNRKWIGSSNGLNMIDQYGETVHPLGTNQIISLKEDGANNLWVATLNGLFIVNPERTEMHLLDKAGGLSDNFVQGFWKRNGDMIVSTYRGFNIIDPIHKTLLKAGRSEGLVTDSLYIAFKDKSGNMWLTGPGNGIELIDSANKISLHAEKDAGLSGNTIMDVQEDNDELIWLATLHGGVDIINPVEGTVKYLNNQPGLKDTCNRLMLLDKYGRIWIGTDKGIYVADKKNGTLTSITTQQGLSNNTILSLLEYNGTVLAGTNNKVTMITPPTPGDSTAGWKISVLDKSENLLKTNTNSWLTDGVTHDGKYLWGDNGITVINKIKPDNDSVATYITGMSVLGQPQYFIGSSSDSVYSGHAKFSWDSVSGPYNLPAKLSLPHTQNYLQFQFAQANLSRPDTTLYTYVLEGIDKNWSTPSMNPYTENYLNLPPGKYIFKVSSKEISGRWSKPTSFSFTILPPWYQTWWAWMLYVLIGLGLLRLYIVYRSRKLKRENKILEDKVKYRTGQLQKSLEDLKATQSQLIQSEKMASLGELTAGIAHEIQNPIKFCK